LIEVSILVPVGPHRVYRQFLGECLDSAARQTLRPSEILIVDDMAGLKDIDLPVNPLIRVWKNPWRLGDVGSFNSGVALAKSDLVFMLSCDDTIRPECLELCVAEWESHHREDAYYYVGAHYMGGEWPDQTVPFSAAMVTKNLWKMTGGFPVETTGCGGDAALISILMTYFPNRLIPVARGKPLYNYRVHKDSETANSTPWMGVMTEARSLATKLWKKPEWVGLE